MEKSTLKRTRLLAPGVIVLICMLPYLKLLNVELVSKKLPDGVFLLILTFSAIFIGGVYYAADCRGLLWRKFIQRCHNNIRSSLIKPYTRDPSIESLIYRLTDLKAMRIFYNIVDNDSSLRDQAHDVRLNGAVLTTIIDCLLISGFFAISYFVAFYFSREQVFLWAAIISVLLQPLLWLLKWRVSEKHISLENEQLRVIAQLHSGKVRSLLEQLK